MPIPPGVLQMDNVFYREPPLKMPDALGLLDRIEARDLTVLNGLLGDRLMIKFFQGDGNKIYGQEWGVAKEAGFDNPDCILISGGTGGVDWSLFLGAGLIPLAHSHPFHRNSPGTTRALTNNGVIWDDINGKNLHQNLTARLKVFPSAGDIAFCAANGLAVHVVKTPYCEVFGGQPGAIRWIVNYDAHPSFAAAPRLSFRIFDVKEMDRDHYRACLVAVVKNQDIWRKHDINVFGGGAAGLQF